MLKSRSSRPEDQPDEMDAWVSMLRINQARFWRSICSITG